MIRIQNKEEIEKMRQGGRILAAILNECKKFVQPGISTKEIDNYSGRLCLKYKVKPAFRDYQNFPANICVSLNNEIVHGLPKEDKVIKEGDLISLDFGVFYRGLYTDSAITFTVGKPTDMQRRLIEVVEKSFYKGMRKVKDGAYLGDVSYEIQNYIEKRGFSVVRTLAGHGIGLNIHEEPTIPNFGRKGTGVILREGMTLAIEPMICEKGHELEIAEDGWTYRTIDGGLSAHFEHTLAVTRKGYEILTTLS